MLSSAIRAAPAHFSALMPEQWQHFAGLREKICIFFIWKILDGGAPYAGPVRGLAGRLDWPLDCNRVGRFRRRPPGALVGRGPVVLAIQPCQTAELAVAVQLGVRPLPLNCRTSLQKRDQDLHRWSALIRAALDLWR